MARTKAQTSKPNPFMAKAAAAAEGAKPKPRKRTSKANLSLVQKVCLEIIAGNMDDELLGLMEAIDTRRDVLKEKLLEQVRAVYGDEYVVTKPTAARARPGGTHVQMAGDPLEEGAERPNEVQATGFAAEGLPDLSMGFGSASIHDSGPGVVTAADPMGGMAEAGGNEITTTGAMIG
jgi:hypothetical protein